jgi:rfaE bifunctional protein kinase chain/domain
VITPSIISRVTKLANSKNIPVMSDPKFRNFHKYKNVTIFKPNMKEFTQGLKIDAKKTDLDILIREGEKFRKEHGQKILMLTLSDKGILVLSDDGSTHIPANKRAITDVSGAGDTVISVSAICHASGMTAAQTAAVANLAGGQVCEKSGVVPVDLENLRKECALYFQKTGSLKV